MFNELKKYCEKIVPVSPQELELIDKYFERMTLKKKEYLLEDGSICNFLGFIAKGSIRHFHIKNGLEKTCDISFENSWVTDFQSFTTEAHCIMNLQAMENSVIYTVEKKQLGDLYRDCPKYETFGRLMAEGVANRATRIAISLSSDKPEERYLNLLNNRPDFFQRIPQKHIANFLGISPESLSRIRARIQKKEKS
ncbi:Crp/Fnr family transcriptional regulator [Maribacter algarum]|uniref:Crp/Fnr family transcriptional regulator n=1 Tax=Maribacter algarum (ex Zhang et al. 2020) TaxID=2578118 RepID=A0A5S3PLP4_9FLAO|nr:Crp/Fnr family transcriptional regulator [Maribacter algarum]TMM53184.1 Crp/Fnr family transcriptional regulator [Maribacter algarum]